ncbi:hypothetical protein [Candidatus Kuenenia sp.]|uniref:hypothetical protein n=1 Tax=Candidatus Kuenenia sp. TaxID=2499824 RepID=UPI00321F7864
MGTIDNFRNRKGWNKLFAGLIMFIMWYVLFGNHKYAIYGKKDAATKETPTVNEEYKKPELEAETP